MDAEKLPKKELGRIYELNLGHTENEWGNRKDRSKKCIIAYDLKWNIDEENVESIQRNKKRNHKLLCCLKIYDVKC